MLYRDPKMPPTNPNRVLNSLRRPPCTLNQRHIETIPMSLHRPPRLLDHPSRIHDDVKQHNRKHRHRIKNVQVDLRANNCTLSALLVLYDAYQVTHQNQNARHVQNPEVAFPFDIRSAADFRAFLGQASVNDPGKYHEEDESDELEGQAAYDEVDGGVLLVWAAIGLRYCSHDLEDEAGDVDQDVNFGDPGDAYERQV